jgi:hypothetical protein
VVVTRFPGLQDAGVDGRGPRWVQTRSFDDVGSMSGFRRDEGNRELLASYDNGCREGMRHMCLSPLGIGIGLVQAGRVSRRPESL